MTGAPLARLAREQFLAGDEMTARLSLMRLIGEVTGLGVAQVKINRDAYSLNSLNGIVTLVSGRRMFFKFHAEEDEDSTVTEYYNAELLHDAGYPVDLPEHVSGEPGRQILLYRLRDDPRLFDVARDLDRGDDSGWSIDAVVKAQERLDDLSARRMIDSLHAATAEEIAAEPVHRLFHDRLLPSDAQDHDGAPAGRMTRFYADKPHALGSGDDTVELTWHEFRDARWVVNGVEYASTVGELFAGALTRLSPAALGPAAVIAHGDAHNANVWCEHRGDGELELVQFDPAFAGRHVPALLAEAKTTFHNAFAHPFWLYEPAVASELFTARARYDDGMIVIEHSHGLGTLRERFVASKAARVWRPLLTAMAERGLLAENWREVVRLALFCCPTLVHELRAGGATRHTPVSAAIGWSIAVAAGSEPVDGSDRFTDLLTSIAPPS